MGKRKTFEKFVQAVEIYIGHGTSKEWDQAMRFLRGASGYLIPVDAIDLVWAVEDYDKHGTHEGREDLILALDKYRGTNRAASLLRSPIHKDGRKGRAA